MLVPHRKLGCLITAIAFLAAASVCLVRAAMEGRMATRRTADL